MKPAASQPFPTNAANDVSLEDQTPVELRELADIIATLHVATVMSVVDTRTFPAMDRPISAIIYQHATYHLNGIVNQFGRDRMEAYLKQEALD